MKKDNIKDKIEMQENFINELEERGNANINSNKKKIIDLDAEVIAYMEDNSSLEEKISGYIKEQESVTGAGDKLVKLNNLRGKLSQK